MKGEFMNDERKRILSMLASGKISADEAEELLDALGKNKAHSSSENETAQLTGKIKKMPNYLRIKVDSVKGDNVNIKIPFKILRAGVKLASLLPPSVAKNVNRHLSERGIDVDFNNIKKEDLDELLEALAEMEINVDSANGDKVRVFCE